ncbi:cysteine methyltransferase [Moraxella osloensis]|uniref:Methylated-DNA--protein-cysteine methyltransferase n=1 Tax=Faucicola osloensis TaxID=34062 RepID=A0AA91FMW0_FAUOS|nr:methylated-DNA--[protein]-cysteine S-methyltransferase [Moraxella osloensis]OBX62170.1 cysteine methyltransferase [Moraxella osloensis]
MLTTNYQLSIKLPTITLVAHKGCLIALDWQTQKILQQLTAQVHYIQSKDLADSVDDDAKVLRNTISQLDEYINGQRQVFDMPIGIYTGTPFQQTVWEALLKIPYGKTISYAQLANHIGQPTACRAVANANGKNPISLIIPCHRVIASDGKLGGYTGGIEIKQTLLDIEQASYQR